MYINALSDNSTDTKGKIITNVLGYPGIGDKRELKKAVESFWYGGLTENALLTAASDIKNKNWKMLKKIGIDLIPGNDFTLYDRMLDMSCMLGAIPDRFDRNGTMIDLDLYFRMARGKSMTGKPDIKPCEMTKWFNTNYHYIVPELDKNTNFRLSSNKIFDEFMQAREIGILIKPVLVGPVTYLMLSKNYSNESFDILRLLDKIVPVYAAVIKRLGELGAEWIQLDEPVFSLDLSDNICNKLEYAYDILGKVSKSKIMVANYFGDLRDNLETFTNLPIDAVHIDAVAAPNEIKEAADAIKGKGKMLSIGIVDGQNIWINDLEASKELLSDTASIIGKDNIMISTSSSLEYVPVSVKYENQMDGKIRNRLSFAREKASELSILSKILNDSTDENVDRLIKRNRAAIKSGKDHFSVNNQIVRDRCSSIADKDLRRKSPYAVRAEKQRQIFNLPELPTTTIGSFPQTKEIRKVRHDFKKGDIDKEEYENFIKDKIKYIISIQKEIGLDVFVHGEPERGDMVEYFSDKLNGFIFTQNGWVRS